ncbi:heparinase II/III-family protein [Rhodanobacter sp. Root179]|uniref:heparinase II/III family protein n=1 Tax=Rhodanobacter sp. Root179 TaxID=1736482 RepID=UPI001910B202|nr:heparinase II/III-family protein [Rhodanobacter sp. Root179]
MSEQAPDWHANPLTGQRVQNPQRPWWQIADFDPVVGDIKAIWESSRFDWVLAHAQRASLGELASLDRLNRWLSDWCINNPAYDGPNWKCGQETSIRVMHLAMAALILKCERSPATSLLDLIKVHLQRVEPTIGYAVAQDNNHGTSEAAALYIGGTWLAASGDQTGKHWARLGRKWLENRVGRLIAADGSFSQYSMTYHRVALDTLSMAEVWRRKFGDASFSARFQKRASAATSWLQAMTDVGSGDAPNLGANDGARLLPLTQTGYRDFRPSVQLAAALFSGRSVYPRMDDVLHWLDIAVPTADAAPPTSVRFDDGGYGILRRGEAVAVMRFPRFRFRPSQADAMHVDLWLAGENVLRDAGTYGYNVDAKWLDYFGGTEGHNTVQFDDRDQMPRLGRFLFGDWLKAEAVQGPTADAGEERFSAMYRDGQGASHRRTLSLGNHVVQVEDQVSGFREKAVLRWRLKPGDWKLSGLQVQCGEHVLAIATDVAIRRIALVEGWESRYYLEKTSVPVLEVEIDQPGTLISSYTWV